MVTFVVFAFTGDVGDRQRRVAALDVALLLLLAAAVVPGRSAVGPGARP